jgi:hypothetical protein
MDLVKNMDIVLTLNLRGGPFSVPAVCSPVEKLCFAVGRSGTPEGCKPPGVDIFFPPTNEQTSHVAGGTREDGVMVALRFK